MKAQKKGTLKMLGIKGNSNHAEDIGLKRKSQLVPYLIPMPGKNRAFLSTPFYLL